MESNVTVFSSWHKLQQSSRIFCASGEIAGVAMAKRVQTTAITVRRRVCLPSPYWGWFAAMQFRRSQSTGAGASESQQQRIQRLDVVPRGTKDGPDQEDRRSENPANFAPSLWGDFFLYYSSPIASSHKKRWMEERAGNLRQEVAKLIANAMTDSLHEKLVLIDALERLCVDHLFQEEVSVMLNQISCIDVSDCDLHTTALWFYLLRKHGYKVSPGVFAKFKDGEGGFVSNNVRDLLSLYNAGHLLTHGESILDEAISFTRRCLESTLPYMDVSLARDITCALDIPMPRRVRIYEAKHFISTYEKQATMNEMIMELGKVNYNIMQMHHQDELKIVTRWWKDLQVESRLSFARDRVVECYFWIVGVYFEPCYSRGRIILAKVLAIVSILDDIYDVYGSPDECELFTKCVERWDPKAAHNLPEYMKFVFFKILDTYQSIEDELVPEEKYRMSYLKNFTIDLVRAYEKEMHWREEGYIPATVDEHLQVSARSGACHLLSCASFVGIEDIATRECFDWVYTVPKIVQTLCIILRLSDDLKSYEREQSSSHVASTIDSCMKEHNITIQVAREKIQQRIEDSWKDFNGEWLGSCSTQPIQLTERIFNLTRTMEFMYKKEDAYTNCHAIKDTIHSLFVEPIL